MSGGGQYNYDFGYGTGYADPETGVNQGAGNATSTGEVSSGNATSGTDWSSIFGNASGFPWGQAANAILGGSGGGAGAGLALGLGALAAALSRQQAPTIKAPEYKAAPIYNRALTAPIFPPQPAPQKSASGQNIYTPLKGMPLFFNPNPFQFDPTEAAKKYGPTQEQIAKGQEGYEAGIASLYKPLSITPFTDGAATGENQAPANQAPANPAPADQGVIDKERASSGVDINAVKAANPQLDWSKYNPNKMTMDYDDYDRAIDNFYYKGNQFDQEKRMKEMEEFASKLIAPTPASTPAPTRAPTPAPTRAPTPAPTPAPTSAPSSVNLFAQGNNRFQRDGLYTPEFNAFQAFASGLGYNPSQFFQDTDRKIYSVPSELISLYESQRGPFATNAPEDSSFLQTMKTAGENRSIDYWNAQIENAKKALDDLVRSGDIKYDYDIRDYSSMTRAGNEAIRNLNIARSSLENVKNLAGIREALLKQPSGYSSGGDVYEFAKGNFLQGDGDGMSDSIPATINNKQPARLADGEFIVPADVVSDLGNGSSNAGAKKLYQMMNKIRKERHGTHKQPPQVKAERVMPK